MKKSLLFGLIMALILCLCACRGSDIQINEQTQPESTSGTVTHSPLYLADHKPDQIWKYYEEIVFDMEYSSGAGDCSLVQKWINPIYYHVNGYPTDEDLTVLTNLFEQLNTIDGFPGIYAADNQESANLTVSFLDADSFWDTFALSVKGEDAYGAATFEYNNKSNEIHTANVGYRTDLDQDTRTSVIMEEIVNMLGVSDTVLRENSIVYQYSNDNVVLSDVDWVILKLLYSSEIACGMNAESCRPIIRELYY